MAIPTPQPLHTNELFSESISNSPFSRGGHFGNTDQNQREIVDLFLQKVDMDVIKEEQTPTAVDASKPEQLKPEDAPASSSKQSVRKRSIRLIEEPFPELPQGSNSLTNLMQTSWSGDLDAGTPTDDVSAARFFQRSVSMSSSVSLRTPNAERCSYNALLRKHENNREAGAGWSHIWEKFRASASNLNVNQQQQNHHRDSESVAADDLSDLQSLDVCVAHYARYKSSNRFYSFTDQLGL